MTDRSERAQHLGKQLEAAMDALAVSTRGHMVVLFLDRLARLEAYPAADLALVTGLPELVAEAARSRAEHASDLARVAGNAVDLDQLLDDGRHLASGDDSGERDSWLRDVLVLATVSPWLSVARRQQATWAIEKASALVEAHAAEFLGASVLAFDRRELEEPAGLGPLAREFLRLLDDLPLLVAVDQAAGHADSKRVRAALRSVDPGLIDAVDDALSDHRHVARIHLPSRTERQALAASDAPRATLVAMEGGRWVVVRQRGVLSLYYEGDETDVGVAIVEGPHAGPVTADANRGYPLPASDEALTLRLSIGPDSRTIQIDAG